MIDPWPTIRRGSASHLKFRCGSRRSNPIRVRLRCVISLPSPWRFDGIPHQHKLSESRVLVWCREGESNPQGTKYRRILSPLRLPVPPSRRFVEVLVFTAYFKFSIFCIQDSECETVQVNVKVIMDFHRSLSLARESLCGSSRATMSPWLSNNEDIRTRFYHPTQS
jgi:hypothetical protein